MPEKEKGRIVAAFSIPYSYFIKPEKFNCIRLKKNSRADCSFPLHVSLISIVCSEGPVSAFRFHLLFAGALVAASAHAQASYTSMPLDGGFGALDTSAPSIPAEQIIQQFTAKESVSRAALDNYTWERSVKVQTIDDDNKVDGQYFQVTDISYDSTGRRTEHVVEAPPNSLERVMMSPADFSDIEERLPFVLTKEDAPQYNITYVGKQKIDEVQTYAFDIRPKSIEKGKRYFEGRIWVDQQDMQIVVTNGKNVPDDLRKGHEDLSMPFMTYRQQIDGKYWFPVYTHGDGVLHFSAGNGYLSQDVHMRETVKYTNYKQYRSTVRVLFEGQDISNGAPAQNGQQPPAQQPESKPQH